MRDPVLSARDLRVRVGRRDIVGGISFDVQRERTLGIVGESGSGKTMTVLAATGLLDAPGAVVTGTSVLAAGGSSSPIQIVGASPRLLRTVLGSRIGFVFQDPGTSLNPLLTLERQITESLQTHRGLTRREARARALGLLEAVGLPDPQTRLDSYPHQLSGGQRQRVMIAIALACDPELLIADEPTTSLDVTTQAQIIDLVRELQRDFGTAVVWISHDIGVVGQVADDVTVLRDGEAVEQSPILELFDRPQHLYTKQLLEARPLMSGTGPTPALADAPVLLKVDGLDVRFGVRSAVGNAIVHAVSEVSFSIRRGTTLGLVGESGSGKSTVAAALTGLVKPDAGSATLDGTDMFGVRGAEKKALRRRISLVFQDPFSSLDPVPMSVSTWPAGFVTNGGSSACAARGAPVSIMPTTAATASAARAFRDGPLGSSRIGGTRPRGGHRRQKCTGVGLLGCSEQFCGGSVFDRLAGPHDEHVVAHLPHDREVVRDEEVGEAKIALQPPEQIEHARLHQDVQ